jgi:hypothetical protein
MEVHIDGSRILDEAFKTKSIRLEVSSPNRKFQAYDRMAFELSENSEKHVIDDARSEMTSDHSKIVWSIDEVRSNWHMRFIGGSEHVGSRQDCEAA